MSDEYERRNERSSKLSRKVHLSEMRVGQIAWLLCGKIFGHDNGICFRHRSASYHVSFIYCFGAQRCNYCYIYNPCFCFWIVSNRGFKCLLTCMYAIALLLQREWRAKMSKVKGEQEEWEEWEDSQSHIAPHTLWPAMRFADLDARGCEAAGWGGRDELSVIWGSAWNDTGSVHG